MNGPFLINSPTSISFSGGRTSAYMLKKVLEANNGLPDCAVVCFANTGKEMPETLEFVRDCGEKWGVDIHWLEFRNSESKFEEVNYLSASRLGEPFHDLIVKRGYLPNPVARFCTVELKVRTIHRYLKSLDWTEWDSMIGIRADEQRRLAKIGNNDYGKYEEKIAPLGQAGITKAHIGQFWKEQDFDLKLENNNGVTMHGNCDLCFLKGGNQVFSLIQEEPKRAVWWANQEALALASKPDGAKFRKDRPSYQQMHDYALSQYSIEMEHQETIECFCGD